MPFGGTKEFFGEDMGPVLEGFTGMRTVADGFSMKHPDGFSYRYEMDEFATRFVSLVPEPAMHVSQHAHA